MIIRFCLFGEFLMVDVDLRISWFVSVLGKCISHPISLTKHMYAFKILGLCDDLL